MRIVKNTSGYETRTLRSLIVRAHNYIREIEGCPAPNWRHLRVLVRGRDRRQHVSGCAYLGGRGNRRYDVCLTLPRTGLLARRVVWLAHHELMHVYGYGHAQFRNISDADLDRLLPIDYAPPAIRVRKRSRDEIKTTRIEQLLAQRKAWQRKLRSAQRRLKKINASIRYYERTQPALIAVAAASSRGAGHDQKNTTERDHRQDLGAVSPLRGRRAVR